MSHRNYIKGWYNLTFIKPSFVTAILRSVMFKNICWAQRLYMLMIAGLFILSVSSMLSGCGNKGDLYLPDTGSKNDSKNSNLTPKT